MRNFKVDGCAAKKEQFSPFQQRNRHAWDRMRELAQKHSEKVLPNLLKACSQWRPADFDDSDSGVGAFDDGDVEDSDDEDGL